MKTTRCFWCLAWSLAGIFASPLPGEQQKAVEIVNALAWPEVTNAKALIEFVRTITADENTDQELRTAFGARGSEVTAYLKPIDTLASTDCVLILLDTRPFTGQALLIVPHAEDWSKDLVKWGRLSDTDVPEIKRVLINLSGNNFRAELLNHAYVRWKDLTNESPDKTSCPYPIKMFAPGYPADMARAGINGEAKVTFTVTKIGEIADVSVVATHAEFSGPAVEAIRLWKFEPGVDLVTRHPAECRVAVTAIYNTTDG